MQAARTWAAGRLFDRCRPGTRAPGDEAAEDARRFGIDPAGFGSLSASQSARTFEGIISVNLPILLAFLAVASQWRVITLSSVTGSRAQVLGLDYAGARIALDALQISVTPHLWAGLQIMEQAAIEALNSREALQP